MHASLLPWISPPSLTILKKQWALSAAVVRTGSTETTSSSSREAVVAASSTTGADGTTTETTETSKLEKSSRIAETPGTFNLLVVLGSLFVDQSQNFGKLF
jgi:hypothetical protein